MERKPSEIIQELHSNQKADTEGVLQIARLDR